METAAERQREIIRTVVQLEHRFRRSSSLWIGSTNYLPAWVIPSGSISLDAALGVGGFPRGRVIEVYGPESSGKTTIALHAVAECQRLGGTAAFLDAECALDPGYANRIGVVTEALIFSQPQCGEQALSIAGALVGSRAVDLIVVDSVAALAPTGELTGNEGLPGPDLHSGLMTQALRKLSAAAARTGACLIFLNQIRHRIGCQYGNPEITTGGRSLPVYASLRLDVRPGKPIRRDSVTVGLRVRVKAVKNRVAKPFRTAEFDLLYGEGISTEADLLDVAVAQGVLEERGFRYSFDGCMIGLEREEARAFLRSHSGIRRTIECRLRRTMGLPMASDGPGEGAERFPKLTFSATA